MLDLGNSRRRNQNQSAGSSPNVMPMQWYRVAIHTNEISVANQSATALIENLGAAYCAAGAPDGVKVYHHRLGPSDHFYYLSLAAASLVKDDLDSRKASLCDLPRDRAYLLEISL